MKNTPVRITCQAFGQTQEAVWRSISQPAPQQMVEADDTLSADGAMAHIKSGKSLLWTGDFHNARQLMTALARRQERASNKRRRGRHRAHLHKPFCPRTRPRRPIIRRHALFKRTGRLKRAVPAYCLRFWFSVMPTEPYRFAVHPMHGSH